MRLLIEDGGVKRPLQKMSFPQTKQAAAIMDCIGRLIPQEGVDYDVEVVFRGVNDPNVSINISPHTDKGEWWRQYVMTMIQKYPPTVENPDPSMPIDTSVDDEEKTERKEGDEEIMS